MVLLQSDGLVSLVAGVEGEERERNDDVPDVSGAAFDGHRVFVMPLVRQARAAAQNGLARLVTTRDPGGQIGQTNLAEGRVQSAVVAPGDERTMDARVVLLGVIAQASHGTHDDDESKSFKRVGD